MTLPAVLTLRALPGRGGARIAAACELRRPPEGASPAAVRQLAAGVVAVVGEPELPVGEELLAAAGPGLRVIANFGVGVDHIDLDACRRRGVMVTNTPDVLTDATAELALALTMASARQLTAAETGLRAGRWRGADPDALLGSELSGLRFGVAGLGRIGTRYARLVQPMAAEILYTSRAPAPAAQELGAVRVELDQLLSACDVVSLHLPGGAATASVIDARRLALMKPTAILVNTARGSLVDVEALAGALQRGELGAAGLDVFAGEPDVPGALLAAPRCILLPHIGSATVRAREAMAGLVADSVLAALAGEEPPNRIA